MDNETYIKIQNSPDNKIRQNAQWTKVETPADEHRFLSIPLYAANTLKKGYTRDKEGYELGNYFTVMDVCCGTLSKNRAGRLPALFRHLSATFGEMVGKCLSLQRQGELTQEMLEVLIDTVEVLSPLERLTMVISDLETYRNMQLLNDLL